MSPVHFICFGPVLGKNAKVIGVATVWLATSPSRWRFSVSASYGGQIQPQTQDGADHKSQTLVLKTYVHDPVVTPSIFMFSLCWTRALWGFYFESSNRKWSFSLRSTWPTPLNIISFLLSILIGQRLHYPNTHILYIFFTKHGGNVLKTLQTNVKTAMLRRMLLLSQWLPSHWSSGVEMMLSSWAASFHLYTHTHTHTLPTWMRGTEVCPTDLWPRSRRSTCCRPPAAVWTGWPDAARSASAPSLAPSASSCRRGVVVAAARRGAEGSRRTLCQ